MQVSGRHGGGMALCYFFCAAAANLPASLIDAVYMRHWEQITKGGESGRHTGQVTEGAAAAWAHMSGRHGGADGEGAQKKYVLVTSTMRR